MKRDSTSIALFAVFIAGAALRIMAATGDPWLDEIWPLTLFDGAPSFSGMLHRISFDGHASLYTAWMFVVNHFGFGFPAMRLLSVVAAIGSLPLFAMLIPIENRWARFSACTLFALSYPVIVVTTEARGYGPMVLLGLWSVLLCKEYVASPRLRTAVFYWLCAAGAFLFHPTGIFWLLACAAYVAVRPRAARSACALFVIPVAIIAAFYCGWLLHLTTGGGQLRSFIDVAVETGSIAFGGPLPSAVWLPGTAIAMLITLAGIIYTACGVFAARQQSPGASFLLMLCFAGPLVVVTVMGPASISVRYFLPAIIGSYAAIGCLLSHQHKRGTQTVLLSCLIVASLLGSLLHAFQFARFKRGNYCAALTGIAAHETSGPITIGSDHDFRGGTLINYFGPRCGGKFVYVPTNESPAPIWYVAHSMDPNELFQFTKTTHGATYRLESVFEAAPLSGFRWGIYRRQ